MTVAKSMDLLNFLIDGVEIPLDNHIKLLITLFLSLLADKPLNLESILRLSVSKY